MVANSRTTTAEEESKLEVSMAGQLLKIKISQKEDYERSSCRGNTRQPTGRRRADGAGGMRLISSLKQANFTRRELPIFSLITAALLLLSLSSNTYPIGLHCVAAQCPWPRDLVALHSDCICDFNPSQTTLINQQPINRMSVQCSLVNFEQLLTALKQTASIELPDQLISETLNVNTNNNTMLTTAMALPTGNNGGDDETTLRNQTLRLDELLSASNQIASQAKLDLLHVSNSSIGRLYDNTFIAIIANIRQQQQPSPLQPVNDLAAAENNSPNNVVTGGHQTYHRSQHLVIAIQSLHLSRCGIELIDPAAFRGLEWSLTSLSLSDNQLESVPARAMHRLINLKVLDLSNNKIIHIRANSFVTLNRLGALRLADNRIGRHQSIQEESVARQEKPPSAVGIIATDSATTRNASQMIDLDAFRGLETSLSDLNLKNTQLSAFPLAIRRLRNLAFLNLAQNQISNLPPRSFEQMSSLTAINFERNRISRLEEDTFVGVEGSLSSLSLLGNLLDSFPSNQLAKLDALRRLDMGFNGLETLPSDAFVSNKRLILVALDGNPLETLPEEAFKPLEGILRGMSIGGKVLNCDCRLSWILRWQQKYNIRISSRERQPQFCAKPHYLRSLVSLAALKPEHLSCSSLASQEPAYFPILQRANATSTGWIAQADKTLVVGSNQQHQSASFMVPFQLSQKPTMSTTTKYFVSNSTTLDPSLTLARASNQISPFTTTTAPTTMTTTTTEEPTTRTSTSVFDQSTDATLQSLADSTTANLIHEQTNFAHATTDRVANLDLTEASTSDEPTLRSDLVTAVTMTPDMGHFSIESATERPYSSLASSQRTPQMILNELSAIGPNDTIVPLLTFGGRTTVISTARPARGLSTQPAAHEPLASNGLGQLPDEELFVIDPTRKKLNRHGVLPSQRRQNGTTTNRGGHIAGGNNKEESPRLKAQDNQQQQQNLTQIWGSIQGIIKPDSARKNKTTTTMTTTLETQTADQSETSTMAPTLISVVSNKTMRPIYSVFGNRAIDGTLKLRENRRAGSSGGGSLSQHIRTQNASISQLPPVVPAVPTTINVYKTTSHHHHNQQQQLMSSNQSTTTTTTTTLNGQRYYERRPFESLNKGARFVNNNEITTTTRTEASPSRSSQFDQRQQQQQQQFDSDDIERYSQASSSHSTTRLAPPTTDTISPSTTRRFTDAVELNWVTEAPRDMEQQATTTTTTAAPQPVTTTAITTTTTTGPNFHYTNNTRMSVSSMYRLSARLPTAISSSSATNKHKSNASSNNNSNSSAANASGRSKIDGSTTTTAMSDTDTTSVDESPSKVNFLSLNKARNAGEPVEQTLPVSPSDYTDPIGGMTVTETGTTEGSLSTTATATTSTSTTANPAHGRRASWTGAFGTLIGSATTQSVNLLYKAPSTTNKPPVSPLMASSPTTSTSMSATVRFVDSSPQRRLVIQHTTPSASTTTTTTSTTTQRPSILELIPAKPSTEPLAVQSQARQISSSPLFIVAPSLVSKTEDEQNTVVGRFAPVELASGTLGVQSHTESSARQQQLAPQVTAPAATPTPPQDDYLATTQTSRIISSYQKPASQQQQQSEPKTTLLVDSGLTRINLNSSTIGSLQPTPIAEENSPDPTSWPPKLITKDSISQQKGGHFAKDAAADEFQQHQPPSGSSNSVKQARFLGRLVKLADYNQLALVLAGILCLLILILTITVVCICYSAPPEGAASNGTATIQQQQVSRLCSFSSGKLLGPAAAATDRQQLKSDKASSNGRHFSWLLCCFTAPLNSAAESSERHVTPMRALILQDDDHSSGESSSNGLKSNGKSMLLAKHGAVSGGISVLAPQDLLLGSIRKASLRIARGQRYRQFQASQQQQRRRTNTTATTSKKARTIKRHQSYAFDNSTFERDFAGHAQQQQQQDFSATVDHFAGMPRAVGRRHSMFVPGERSSVGSRRCLDDSDIIMGDRAGANWIQDETLSSCDSDKSCSPGANRNNRYNISEAHRACLSSNSTCAVQAQQIQASMFVTSTPGTNKKSSQQRSSKSKGLLKTIEHGPAAATMIDHSDYFDRLSRVSASDRSTTDDSRAPLNSVASSRRTADSSATECHKADAKRSATLHQHQHQHQQQHQPRRSTMRNTSTSFGALVARSRSIGRQKVKGWSPAVIQQQQFETVVTDTRVSSECDDYQHSELVPMSAEDQWPEPYLDPADEEQQVQLQLQHAPQQQQQAYSFNAELAEHYPSTTQEDYYHQRSHSHIHNHRNNNSNSHHSMQSHKRDVSAAATTATVETNNVNREHRRTGSSGHQLWVAHDDTYLSNWRTMSKGRRHAEQAYATGGLAGSLQLGPGAAALIGASSNNLIQKHHLQAPQQVTINENYNATISDDGGTSAGLTRYRSIPSLSESHGLLSNQAPGAASWLRWTPPPSGNFINGSGNAVGDHQHAESTSPQTANNLSHNAASNGDGGRWHRDNHIESMYVATDRHQL